MACGHTSYDLLETISEIDEIPVMKDDENSLIYIDMKYNYNYRKVNWPTQ